MKHLALKLTATKKAGFFREKISESIAKPKELWKSLKHLGMLNKSLILNFNVMEDYETLTYETQSIPTIFKNLFSNLAQSLLTKLPDLQDKYNLKSFINYYCSFTITHDFCLYETSKTKVLKIDFKN